MADATLLSWINAEVDQALKLVRENIAKFLSAREDETLLRVCPQHLHQVSGALRMVGLSGATRVCEAIEGSFGAAIGDKPNPAAIGVIDRAVAALKDFVSELSRGQANMPLRLFPVYRELASLQGKADASERDLFFPDVARQAPPHASPRSVPAEERGAFVHAQRANFQRGLLGWLRKQPAGVQQMQQSLDALHAIAAQLPEPRSLWWVALALTDALAKASEGEWLNQAKVLLNRLDFHMRDLAGGSQAVNDPLLRDLLYAVCKSRSSAPRIRQVKQLYQIETLFPADQSGIMELNLDWLEPALKDARSRLVALKSAWLQYVSGEPKSVLRFRELVAAFKTKAAELGNQHLVKLLDAIALVTTKLPDPHPRQKQFMVIEMASAFLLVESVIDNFTTPPSDLEQQIVIMGGWLLDAAQGASSGEPPAGLRADLSERIGLLQVRAQVAKEIVANLQHVEQVLDAYARDASKRNTLTALAPYLRQIHGALFVLRFERAAEVLAICETLIARCAAAAEAQSSADMDSIAEGLSSLGMFLEPCLSGREPAEKAIALFFSRYEKRAALPLAKPSLDFAAQPAAPQAASVEKPADQELLSIFLEEAGDVLGNIDGALPLCRNAPDNVEALTTIRRGFHTLKGSGRMVGLTDLGEVAWQIEQMMNRWLEMKQPATPALLELIAKASSAFSGWIEELRAGRQPALEAKDIVEHAARLKAGETSPPAPAEASAEEVSVGEVRLSRNFFDIYVKEAAQHIVALNAECQAWRRSPGSEASHEFMRAAHTLASSSRTAGFAAIADLAAALEHWLPVAPQAEQPADVEPVQSAIAKLGEMVDAVTRGEAPVPANAAMAALKDLSARLKVPPPAPQPAPEPAAASGRELRKLHDDIDEQLLPIFVEEAQQLAPQLGADLRDWKAKPGDPNITASLKRALHTFKGSARMAGAIRLGELTHMMESRVEAALEANDYPPALFDELQDKMDRLTADLERLQGAPAPAPSEPVVAPAEPAAAEAAKPAAPLPSPAATLRVNADTLDHLINESGEVAIARTRIEAELRVVKQSLADLTDSIARLRSQLREVEVQADSQMQSRLSVMEERKREFDPLEFDRYTRLQELTRMMAESLHDATAIQQTLAKTLGETDSALTHQARISREVQQELMRMRAVPFSNLNERLHRVVRQAARDLGKQAELEIEGSQVELDRSVLERIGAPIEHMLRNALAHGIESPQARLAAGKAEAGRIAISLRQESNEIALILSDDGGGIDLAKLRAKAVDKGVLAPDQATSEADLTQILFTGGLSTADTVTEISGRGVGMDVVRNEIAALGGRVDVATARGKGTTFTLYLPLTLAVTQAVMVRAGATVVAVSSAMVEQVQRLKADALVALYETKNVEFQGNSYPLHYLQHLLGASVATEVQTYNSLLLLRSGIQRVAVHVDALLGNQEIVVKNIGPQLARVPGVAGATVLADGAIVLIVNPVQLASRGRVGQTQTVALPRSPTAPRSAPLILVVDDSLTVRKITGRLLEREGYRVLTAKDGVDALELMKEMLPDVMLVDIEMPRMDGFDLTKNVRADARTAAIPIIIISSRTAEKHRSQAAELGVNAFLGKPYHESELLREVAAHLGT